MSLIFNHHTDDIQVWKAPQNSCITYDALDITGLRLMCMIFFLYAIYDDENNSLCQINKDYPANPNCNINLHKP